MKEYLRYCNININLKCQRIFKTLFSRSRVCPVCKNTLDKLKISIEGYKKMNKEPIKETVEWKDKDNCILRATQNRPVNNEKGELIGSRSYNFEGKATKEDIKVGIEKAKEMLRLNIKQIEGEESKLKQMGKIPAKTPEMIRVEKCLNALGLIMESKKSLDKIKNLNEENEEHQEVITRRTKILEEAPKE